MNKQILIVAFVAAVIGAAVGGVIVLASTPRDESSSPKEPYPQEVTVDTTTPGWATLGITSSRDEEILEVPLVWTDQARVCWDISGDLEKLSMSIFGNEVSEAFTIREVGSDCKYFLPTISHAAATDCATVSASDVGDIDWAAVVQQEVGVSYGLSGINSTRQYGLLQNPCSGEDFPVPPGFIECDDGTYAETRRDCTWAERQFAPYHPEANAEWTCNPTVGECTNPEVGVVPEGPRESGSYCDRQACYLDD